MADVVTDYKANLVGIEKHLLSQKPLNRLYKLKLGKVLSNISFEKKQLSKMVRRDSTNENLLQYDNIEMNELNKKVDDNNIVQVNIHSIVNKDDKSINIKKHIKQ